MSAKLYMVTVTQISSPQSKVWMSKYWVAANSPAQARKKALDACYREVPVENIHVRAVNYVGGVQRISYETLRVTP